MNREARIQRWASVPDPIRVSRCHRLPELGPRLLFFSGGSAIRGLSRRLKEYTHHSTHLITPFDSGGSSARLRQAFSMLSVGDLRNRLIALADESESGNREIYELFQHRLPMDETPEELRQRLDSIEHAKGDLLDRVPAPMQHLIRSFLSVFRGEMGPDFDLRGASIGNLVLAGGYLRNHCDIESVVFEFSKLVEVRGAVHPIVNEDLHLAATLEDGTEIIGQHLLTGKEVEPLRSPIAELRLVSSKPPHQTVQPAISSSIAERIREAELVCFPMGSFFTSLIANLLPAGVGRAVGESRGPRVYIPNCGNDPEQLGLSLLPCIDTLERYLARDRGTQGSGSGLLTHILVDSGRARGLRESERSGLQERGIEVIAADLTTEKSAPLLDSRRTAEALVSLV